MDPVNHHTKFLIIKGCKIVGLIGQVHVYVKGLVYEREITVMEIVFSITQRLWQKFINSSAKVESEAGCFLATVFAAAIACIASVISLSSNKWIE